MSHNSREVIRAELANIGSAQWPWYRKNWMTIGFGDWIAYFVVGFGVTALSPALKAKFNSRRASTGIEASVVDRAR
jgi:hypothetical protein